MTASQLRLRSGDSYQDEETAEKTLAQARRGTTAMADKTDYLSREQMILRRSKEVYNHLGVPDASIVSGIYRRVHNPEAGNRPRRSSGSDD